ncbi:MAG: hypothetical protein KH972_08970 [Peptostreptococcaceae bacterium]|nr:hypothetical protein [Peptostreptococcaceae bacterium]
MNWTKIQQDLLKQIDKNPSFVKYGKYDEDHTCFTWNGFSLFIIPNDKLLVDFSKLDNKPIDFKDYTFKNGQDIKMTEWTKLGYLEFQAEDETKIYFDPKLLKYFEKEQVSYKGKGRVVDPMYIFNDGGKPVAIVLPIRMKK